MIASTPLDSRKTASSTVVAEHSTRHPDALTRSYNSSSGKPKWKLTTCGRACSITSHISLIERTAPCRSSGFGYLGRLQSSFPVEAGESMMPFLDPALFDLWLSVAEEVQVEGFSRTRTDDGGLLPGCVQGRAGRMAMSPSPPPWQTAITIADPFAPAIGAWMTGASKPIASANSHCARICGIAPPIAGSRTGRYPYAQWGRPPV